LEELGIQFEVIASDVDETLCELEDPIKRAQVLARLKAEDVYAKYPDYYVIGSDTLVVSHKGNLLEKPQDKHHAREMLREQSGGVSQVHSAISLLAPKSKKFEGVETSHVHFRTLTDEELDWWISLGLWKDRSGSFQIEGEGEKLIEHLEGDYTGVVGLPMGLLRRLLEEAGV